MGLQKDNVDARILLASCLVESSSDPMKGIGMLKELERKDSTNTKVQYSLALFSVRSGQLEKAVERFARVLRHDSSYTEVYLHLADAYEKMNERDKALRALENYKIRTTDPIARMEVEKYIDQLKKQ